MVGFLPVGMIAVRMRNVLSELRPWEKVGLIWAIMSLKRK